jgi:cytochrome c-type biogenesis protein
VVPTLLFVAGFTIVFVVLGATAGAWVSALRGVVVQRVSGTIVVLLGLFMLAYAFRWGRAALFQERRPFLERARPGTFGALPLGMAFATGWTPCIGPVLGAILTLAATGSAARGAFLLICYSAGLGVPFLLVGLGIDWFMGTFDWVKRNYRWIAGASGAILVVLGVLVFTGELSRVLNQWSGGFTPGL